MGDQVTEREAVRRERAAFMEGGAWQCHFGGDTIQRHDAAAVRYPLPRRVRPRVVKDPHTANLAWRWGGTWFEYRNTVEGEWFLGRGLWDLTPERVRVLFDLLAHPTEEVEDDGQEEER